jgi:hypothetical protein
MRILAWNVGHQTRKKTIPVEAAEALARLEPDAIVLTEYVAADSHLPFIDALQAVGFAKPLVSGHVRGQNQVLIASKPALSEGCIRCPADLSPADAPNWLHTQTRTGLHLIGMRRPMYTDVARGGTRYWAAVATGTLPLVPTAAIIIGDFNCGPTSRCLRPLTADGWRLATPPTGWSFQGKTGHTSSIDHALVTSSVSVHSVHYTLQNSGFRFAGRGGYSDHAVLSIQIRTS